MTMAARRDPRPLVDCIEALIQQDVGRNLGPLFAAARGGLWGAASALARGRPGPIGLITGFYVPQGSPPAAETDGPVGAALLARGGYRDRPSPWARLATDEPCRGACAVALAAAGAVAVPVDSVAIGAPLAGLVATWRRPGLPRRFRSSVAGTAPTAGRATCGGKTFPIIRRRSTSFFAAGPWQTVAVGDGGNEIGMGALPHALIAAHVAHGDTIACVTPAQHLIVAGVSNWGAYALIGALALLREDWRARLSVCLDETLDRRVLETMVEQGRRSTASRGYDADGRQSAIAVHNEKLRRIRALAGGADAV